MDGRAVYDFVIRNIPHDMELLLKKNNLNKADVDKFLFHQASRKIIDKLIESLDIPVEKTPFAIENYGNTVSSSIPLLLADEMNSVAKTIALSGFGVGLSWASTILMRLENNR